MTSFGPVCESEVNVRFVSVIQDQCGCLILVVSNANMTCKIKKKYCRNDRHRGPSLEIRYLIMSYMMWLTCAYK